MIARGLAGVIVVALCGSARAESPPDAPPGVGAVRLFVLASAAIAHYFTDYVIEDRLAPDVCRWCTPPAFEKNIRRNVVWDDRRLAVRMSDVTGFMIAPVVSLGLFAVAAREAPCPGRRLFHDAIPVLETAVYTQLFVQAVKYSVGRQRPAVHFDGTGGEASSEDNLSFPSGHTTLAFSLAVSSGFVARRRGYAIEPVIWISTLALAATTGYLRMAGDRHYFTDVLAGAAIGTAGGYLIPHLGRRLGDHVIVMPSANGIALTSVF